jgi:hypothetical protein
MMLGCAGSRGSAARVPLPDPPPPKTVPVAVPEHGFRFQVPAAGWTAKTEFENPTPNVPAVALLTHERAGAQIVVTAQELPRRADIVGLTEEAGKGLAARGARVGTPQFVLDQHGSSGWLTYSLVHGGVAVRGTIVILRLEERREPTIMFIGSWPDRSDRSMSEDLKEIVWSVRPSD